MKPEHVDSEESKRPGLIERFLQRIGLAAKGNGAGNRQASKSGIGDLTYFDRLKAEIARDKDEQKAQLDDSQKGELPSNATTASESGEKAISDAAGSAGILPSSGSSTKDAGETPALPEGFQQPARDTAGQRPLNAGGKMPIEPVAWPTGDERADSLDARGQTEDRIETAEQTLKPAADSGASADQTGVTDANRLLEDALADFERKRKEIESALKDRGDSQEL